jgi:hypothetical protein
MLQALTLRDTRGKPAARVVADLWLIDGSALCRVSDLTADPSTLQVIPKCLSEQAGQKRASLRL